MKRIMVIFFMSGILFSAARSQTQKGEVDIAHLPVAKDHYLPEYGFDRTDSAQWINVTAGLHVSFATSDRHYFRTEPPHVKESTDWQETGWKGERLNAMILVWSPDTLRQIRFTLHDLISDKGARISKNT